MAVVWSSDAESGDTTDFDSTGGTGTFEAATAAANLGTYGYRAVGSGSGYGTLDSGTVGTWATDLYMGFHLYIDSNYDPGAFVGTTILEVVPDDYSGKNFGIIDDSGGTSPDRWTTPAGTSTTNYSTDEWHWIVYRVRINDGSTGGTQLWVDGDLVLSNLTTDYSGATAWVQKQIGCLSTNLGSGEFIYIDNIIIDDADYPAEPSAPSGVVVGKLVGGGLVNTGLVGGRLVS